MRKKFCLIFVFIFFGLLNGQRPSNISNIKKITISGNVLDQETNQPLEYATITLKNIRFPDRIQGGISNENGRFDLEIFPGKYNVSIEYIGFNPIKYEGKVIRENMDFGKILMVFSENQLEEIELIGERTEVEIRLDKKIYNVGKDIMVRGGSVADVLDNVPSVSVDVEGNVALRGNDNVRILINGKPSGLVGISGPQGLRSLPAESIEKVEVVTSPSARYDAEGTAGILNIILKKQNLEGINGTLTGSVGLPKNNRTSANLNWRTKKLNIFTTNTLSDNITKGNSFNNNEYFNRNDPSTFLKEKRLSQRNRKSFFSSYGLEYYFNDKTSLTLSSFYRESDRESNTKNKIQELDFDGNSLNLTERKEDEDEKDISKQYSANFFKDFKKEGHRFTALFQYEESYEDEYSDINNQTLIPVISEMKYEKVINDENQRRILAQSDYVLPIDENTQFEIGYRGSFSTQKTDYQVSYLINSNYELDNNLSNYLIYREYVNAAYTQYGKKIDKFSYLLGLRMEDSKIEIDQKTSNDKTIKKYTDFFPTLNLSYELNEKESFTLGYSRRLRRPRSRFINPFPSRSSVTNIFQGNPDLDPTYSNAFDLGYLKRWKTLTLNSSIYYQKATKAFTFIRQDSGETVIISGEENNTTNPIVEVPVIKLFPINLSENNRYGGEFSISYFPSRKIRLSGNFNLFSSEIIGDYKGESFDAKNLSWFARFNSTIKLPGSIDWQTRFFYRGPSENAQTKSKGILFLSGALNKEVFNKKGTISFRATDLLDSSRRKSETLTESFYSYGEFQWREPSYVITLTYQINPNKKKKSRRSQRNYGNGQDEGFDF
ncbi:MAG: TonB-dependent receptor [Flavobacteriaceae bacterium]|nr:TonB-dependent receptor [Flavobacteriaceae bacterium]